MKRKPKPLSPPELFEQAINEIQTAAAEAEAKGNNWRWFSEDIGEVRDRLLEASKLDLSPECHAFVADLFCTLGKIGQQMRGAA